MNKKRKFKIITIVCVLVFNIIVQNCIFGASSEVPQKTYNGIEDAPVMMKNINYIDVGNSNSWAKPAIYENRRPWYYEGLWKSKFRVFKYT